MKELVYYYNEMDKLYRGKSDSRWASFKVAMNLFVQFNGKRIVETGCARLPNDWGGGLSTMLFGDFCSRLNDGSHVWTVDLSSRNMEMCKNITSKYSEYITYNVGDSVEYLSSIDIGGKIDLLYLDSYDYEYGELLNIYGGRTDIDAAIKTLHSMTEDEIVKKHGDVIKGSQDHCVKELYAALPHIHDKTIILIDDNNLPGGGKPRLAKDVLIELGYVCLYDWQQTLWLKDWNCQ